MNQVQVGQKHQQIEGPEGNINVILKCNYLSLFLSLFLDVSENMRELLSEITKKEMMSTSKRMGYLNNFSQVIKIQPCFILGFAT